MKSKQWLDLRSFPNLTYKSRKVRITINLPGVQFYWLQHFLSGSSRPPLTVDSWLIWVDQAEQFASPAKLTGSNLQFKLTDYLTTGILRETPSRVWLSLEGVLSDGNILYPILPLPDKYLDTSQLLADLALAKLSVSTRYLVTVSHSIPNC